MPINDNDYTAMHLIGKVYDNDYTAFHQIGKVYDNDYTAKHLIYTAGYSIIDNFSSYTVHNWDFSQPLASSSWGLKKSGNNLIYTCGEGKQNVNLLPIFDLSKYSKLVITVSAQTLNTSKGVRIGFVTWENRGADYFEAKAEIYKTGTYTVNLSSLNSSLYFAIRPINDTSHTGTLTISELTLEE